MATSLGSLVVSLGLNAAEFVTGLTKSEYEARKFARTVEKNIATAANAAGIAIGAMTAAAVGAFIAVDQLAKQAANFKDLEEKTGANAEALASFSVAAQVAGTNMDAVAQATVKLTKNLTGVDDESKAAGAALTALGIPIQAFKALDPAAQMEAVAKALAGFKDGASKTAVALALFGKAGADILPFLKELEAQGGRQVILTQAQIEAADNYSDAQARAKAQLNAYAQVAATQALPAINAFTGALIEAVKTVVGMDDATKSLTDNNSVQEFAETSARALAVLVEGVALVSDAFRSVGITIGASLAIITNSTWEQAKAIKAEADADIDRIGKRRSFIALLDDQFAKQKRVNEISKLIPDSVKQDKKPVLNFAGAKSGATAGASERITEAQRFLESLQKQLDKTQELGAVEQAVNEIRTRGLKGLTPDLEKEILFIAQRIDQEKELKAELVASAKAQEEMARAMAHAARERQHSVDAAFNEAASIKEANDALQDEITIILGGAEARKALEVAHINSAIAKREDALATELLNNGEGDTAVFLRAQIDLLEKRKGLLVQKEVAETFRAEAEAMKAFTDTLSNEFANALSDVVTGTKSVKEAFADMGRSITRILTDIAAKNLAKSLFGGSDSGPDIFSLIAKLVGGLAGGGGGDIGTYWGAAAAGSNFTFGGRTMVGENGPEIIDMPRGAKVWPNGTGPGGGGDTITVENNFHITGAVDTRSQAQIATQVGKAVNRAMWRR